MSNKHVDNVMSYFLCFHNTLDTSYYKQKCLLEWMPKITRKMPWKKTKTIFGGEKNLSLSTRDGLKISQLKVSFKS